MSPSGQKCSLLRPEISPALNHQYGFRTCKKWCLKKRSKRGRGFEPCRAGITAVLDECGCTLRALSENLLEAVFTLAQDDWPQVATPCREWLSRRSALPQQASRGSLPSASPGSRNSTTGAATASGGSDDVVLGIASRLVLGLEAALQRGEHEGTLHARRLCTALQVCTSCFHDSVPFVLPSFFLTDVVFLKERMRRGAYKVTENAASPLLAHALRRVGLRASHSQF